MGSTRAPELKSHASRAPQPSCVTLPNRPRPYPGILEYLVERFDKIGRETWRQRMESGAITGDAGSPITLATPYRPHLRLYYHREVETEPRIPFTEDIVFRDEHLLVACKPHFLPVTPSGPWVNECLLYRLRSRTGLRDLVPLHRLDRETAGLVLFSVNRATRTPYGEMVRRGNVRKIYEAVALTPTDTSRREWLVETRIVRGDPWFLSRHAEGTPNARTKIRLLEARGCHARLELEPLTGKHHQLRLHLTAIGSQVVNDSYYPVLQPQPKTGYDRPLLLLARELHFTDPLTGRPMSFRSSRRLAWP